MLLSEFSQLTQVGTSVFRPLIFNAHNSDDMLKLSEIRNGISGIEEIDTLSHQVRDLIKIRHPEKSLNSSEIEQLSIEYLSSDQENQGIWVYYPWRHCVIRLLREADFTELRTSRNLYKITLEEQNVLSTKKVGMIGLSVGHSMAMNIALERSAGYLRLADFDSIEVSNLNRIRTSLLSLGIPKVIVAAREIAEIDPFLNVEIYPDGISRDNLDDFLNANGKLDLLIEECDSLEIKILSRQRAKKLGIPVLMETSDRGMIDVERFDLEPNRPILHGLIEHLNAEDVSKLKTSEEKIPFLMPMVGIETMSPRLKASALEVGTTLTTWPQLGTSVMLGGAVLADTYRRIMLNQFSLSGRFIVDPAEKLVTAETPVLLKPVENPTSINNDRMRSLTDKLKSRNASKGEISREIIVKIVEATGKAPSGGNSQPWHFLSRGEKLYLFLDRSCSHSFMDYKHSASYISLGCAAENAIQMAASLGYKAEISTFPLPGEEELVAELELSGLKENLNEFHFPGAIGLRFTDRRIMPKSPLNNDISETISAITALFPHLRTFCLDSVDSISQFGDVVCAGDRLRILYPESHNDFINAEMRWSAEDAGKLQNGIFVEELELSLSDLAGLNLVKDNSAVEFLRKQGGGRGLQKISKKIVESSPAIYAVFADKFDMHAFFDAGRMLERIWLYCTTQNVGLQVLNVPVAFLLRHKNNDVSAFDDHFNSELDYMVNRMRSLIPGYDDRQDVLYFRVFNSTNPKPVSVRKDLNKILDFD